MELQSTVSFKQIDIDKMLEHTSLDDFMRGLYTKAAGINSNQGGKSLMEQIMSTGETSKADQANTGP